MSSLSVCMIVKNEEKVLNRCLQCVQKFADEIIVVDTGSTDKTIEIAKKYTKNVYFFDWKDDFSLARNYSVKFATCEYIMWLDADDVITDKNIAKINQLKNKLIAETYMLKYQIAFDENDNCTFEYFRERIVKNCSNAKFVGFVHEVIIPFGRIEYLDVAIEHRKIEAVRDTKRNLKIYKKNINNGVIFNQREQFYYSKELFYNKYYKKTISNLKKFLKMQNKFLPNIIDAYITISDCYFYLNDLKNSKKYLIESMNTSPPNALVCCKLGFIYIQENNYKNAIFWYKTALNCQKNKKSGEFIENDYFDFIPYLQLSFCYYYLNDYENFVKYHKKAKALKPYDKAILNNEKFVK